MLNSSEVGGVRRRYFSFSLGFPGETGSLERHSCLNGRVCGFLKHIFLFFVSQQICQIHLSCSVHFIFIDLDYYFNTITLEWQLSINDSVNYYIKTEIYFNCSCIINNLFLNTDTY